MHSPLLTNRTLHTLMLRSITGILITAVLTALFVYAPPIALSVFLVACCAYILIIEWPALCPVSFPTSVVYTMMYPVLSFARMLYLNHHNRELLGLLFIYVAAHDVGAYIVGSLIGRTPIAPSISPNKTWEGALGGYIALIATILIIHGTNSWLTVYLHAALIAALALLGDLFESWLKRRIHIKDSGSLLPGHGGLLDRFDSLLLVVFFPKG